MLRVFHTADWHLGHSFHGYDRDYEHGLFLEWLLALVGERKPDALLMAGDVFDTVNPSAAAQRRFYDFLARAHAAVPAMQMVFIAGNHDAAARLEAPQELFQSLNITVVGTVARDATGEMECGKFLVPLKDATGTVRGMAVAVPFLRPHDLPTVAADGVLDSYLDGVKELYRRAVGAAREVCAREYPGAVLIALGHCHMQEAAESRDSERRIVIGTAEALRADTFPEDVAYVALGHLHRPQELDGGRIRYAGSPIPLSFSECDYEHRVLELSIEGTAVTSVTPWPVPKTAALLRIPRHAPAPMAEVLRLLGEIALEPSLPVAVHPFLEVRVLDDGPDPGRRRTIEQAIAGKPVRLAFIKVERARAGEADGGLAEPVIALADLRSLDPMEIMTAAHRERYQTEPAPALLAALQEILSTETHLPGGIL